MNTDYSRQDPSRHVSLLQQCLSGGKKPIGLLLGAGCPMAIPSGNGNEPLIPDIEGITVRVRERLTGDCEIGDAFVSVEGHLKEDGNPDPTVEDLLTHIRALHAVAGNGAARGLTKAQLENLDERVCELIHQVVDQELPSLGTPYHNVAMWANAIPREFPVEIFTTNYDLLVEQALEESRVPYFDGFAGVRRPLFDPQMLESDSVPKQWTRLWKLHGSINWHLTERFEVFRGSTIEAAPKRVIHPSHLKYQESRRMPYLAMADRMRTFMRLPASALIICGYSFGDEHINENIVQGLQHTQTAVAFALMYGSIENYPVAVTLAESRPNLNVLAEDGGVLGGQKVKWPVQEIEETTEFDTCALTWKPVGTAGNCNIRCAAFNLGDFEVFGQFLRELIGSSQASIVGAD